MLQGIFGNQDASKILLSLFVNETCDEKQFQELTTLKELQRLEQEGIITSYDKNNRKHYKLSSTYPLKHELEDLLKKAYTLLPCSEKKAYYCTKSFKNSKDRSKKEELLLFWGNLKKINHLFFLASSKRNGALSSQAGEAQVEMIPLNPHTLVSQEKGSWIQNQVPGIAFNNSFRWTLDLGEERIGLEHLRYGSDHPVFLFYLAPSSPFTLEAANEHVCAADIYLGKIEWSDELIEFHWRIVGPLKNDQLTYQYSLKTTF